MNINELPNDCLFIILGNVELSSFKDEGNSVSYLNKLTQCYSCYIHRNFKCSHLHETEVLSRKILRLVCKKWKVIIDKYYRFDSGPSLYLNI